MTAKRHPAGLVAAVLAGALAFGVLVLGACTSDPPNDDAGGTGAPSAPGELHILASSELADVEGLLDELKAATGVTVTMDYTGTLDGTEKLLAGSSGADAAWFASDRYLRLLPGGATATIARNPIMFSPVVLGVRTPLAQRFGWTGGAGGPGSAGGAGGAGVSWADVAARVSSGELTYAMTNPAASNSGFSALVGVAAALAGTADALTVDDVRPAELTSFFAGQAVTAGSSGWLVDAFANAPDSVGGIINYESVLLSLAASGRVDGGLTLVYPRDGIITADYPLMLVQENKRAEYDRVVGWLRSPEAQRLLQTQTFRRPAVPGVALDPAFGTAPLVELPFPATQQVADELLGSYFDKFRRPTHAIFVLDVSGSMRGDRLDALRSTLRGLAGADPSLAGRFARFRGRERITLMTFSSAVDGVREFTVADPSPGSADLAAISAFADGLAAGGDTAIYSALSNAYDVAGEAVAADPSYLTSIVLMTDGENNRGITDETFRDHYDQLPAAARGVRTFTVAFGEADTAELDAVSTATGGRTFDARESGLADAFREIRGYQ